MAVTNGSFAWSDKQDKPTLANINISIPRGKLVAIVGQVRIGRDCVVSYTDSRIGNEDGLVFMLRVQVGAGKSSMIAALLGQMTKLSGKVCGATASYMRA